jgi:hypothetical protein
MLLPWIDLVVNVGEEVTSSQIIARLMAPGSPARGGDGVPYRNLKSIPNANAFSYLMVLCPNYKKLVGVSGQLSWKRVE